MCCAKYEVRTLTRLLPQVLNSGGQLQISRPAPEPPQQTNNRVNGGGAVYQQPHQHQHQQPGPGHTNGSSGYEAYQARPGQPSLEEEALYDQYHQSSVSDQYDMRHHEDRMYAERAGQQQQLQQHHSSPNIQQQPGHHRTSSGSQYGSPGPAQYNGNGGPPQAGPPTSQYNGASYQQQQPQQPQQPVQIPIQRQDSGQYAPAPPQPPPAPAAPPAPALAYVPQKQN